MISPSKSVEGQTNHNDAAAANASVTACPNCHAEMPGQMRFCRMCGYRLGEGVAEYAETVRFQGPPTGAPRPVQTENRNQAGGASGQPFNTSGSLHDMKTMAHQAAQRALDQSQRGMCRSRWMRGSSWPHWFIWPIIGIAMSVAVAGGHATRSFWQQVPVVRISTDVAPPPPLPPIPGDEEESVLGANDFKNADGGGATFDSVTPGSAADKAGLVGGDIINNFDGHPVKDSEQLEELLAHTPPGKTVPVVFSRDGKTQTTSLKTVSEAENDQLEEQADEGDESLGYIGEGTDLERVRAPGMNLEGVRLGEIEKNNPAYIAGLRDGDIVIEFNNVPIRTRAEFESRIRRATPGSTVKTIIVRDGQRQEIPVKIGQDD